MNAREQAFWERAFLAYIAAGEPRDYSATQATAALAVWRAHCPDLAADPKFAPNQEPTRGPAPGGGG